MTSLRSYMGKSWHAVHAAWELHNGMSWEKNNFEKFYIYIKPGCMMWWHVAIILTYWKTGNISGTKSQKLNVSHLVLQLSLPNPLKPGWEWKCSWGSTDRQCSNYMWVINSAVTYMLEVWLYPLSSTGSIWYLFKYINNTSYYIKMLPSYWCKTAVISVC